MKIKSIFLIIFVMCSCSPPSKKMIKISSITVESYKQNSKSSGKRGHKKIVISKPHAFQYRIDVEISVEAPKDAILKVRFTKEGDEENVKLVNSSSSVVTPFYIRKILTSPVVVFSLKNAEGKYLDSLKVTLPVREGEVLLLK